MDDTSQRRSSHRSRHSHSSKRADSGAGHSRAPASRRGVGGGRGGDDEEARRRGHGRRNSPFRDESGSVGQEEETSRRSQGEGGSESQPLLRDHSPGDSGRHSKDKEKSGGGKEHFSLLAHLVKCGRLAWQAQHADFSQNGAFTAKVLREAAELSRPLLKEVEEGLERRERSIKEGREGKGKGKGNGNGRLGEELRVKVLKQGVRWVEAKVEEAEEEVERLGKKERRRGHEERKEERRRKREERGERNEERGGEDGSRRRERGGDQHAQSRSPARSHRSEAPSSLTRTEARASQHHRSSKDASPSQQQASTPRRGHGQPSGDEHSGSKSRRRRRRSRVEDWMEEQSSRAMTPAQGQQQHGEGLAADYYNSSAQAPDQPQAEGRARGGSMSTVMPEDSTSARGSGRRNGGGPRKCSRRGNAGAIPPPPIGDGWHVDDGHEGGQVGGRAA